MSDHNRVYEEGSPFQRECTCGWYAYGARDPYDADGHLTRHLIQESKREKAGAAAEVAELEQRWIASLGQNWDLP